MTKPYFPDNNKESTITIGNGVIICKDKDTYESLVAFLMSHKRRVQYGVSSWNWDDNGADEDRPEVCTRCGREKVSAFMKYDRLYGEMCFCGSQSWAKI